MRTEVNHYTVCILKSQKWELNVLFFSCLFYYKIKNNTIKLKDHVLCVYVCFLSLWHVYFLFLAETCSWAAFLAFIISTNSWRNTEKNSRINICFIAYLFLWLFVLCINAIAISLRYNIQMIIYRTTFLKYWKVWSFILFMFFV